MIRLKLTTIPHVSHIRHAQRNAKLYGEHVTLSGDNVTREHCIIESIELTDKRDET